MKDIENKEEETLSDVCRNRMQIITKRRLHLLLAEMKSQDKNATGLLPVSAVHNILAKQEPSLAACLPRLGKKFEDKDNPGYINYEQIILYAKSHL